MSNVSAEKESGGLGVQACGQRSIQFACGYQNVSENGHDEKSNK